MFDRKQEIEAIKENILIQDRGDKRVKRDVIKCGNKNKLQKDSVFKEIE